MIRRWVIPDIHGCIDTLKALIEEQIKPTSSDELYFLGDYIDRGPDTKGVIDYLRSLKDKGFNTTFLTGNHEAVLLEIYEREINKQPLHFLRIFNRKKRRWFSMGGKETLKSFGVHKIKNIPPEYIKWIRSLDYYVILENFILVHAGLNCNIEDPFSDTRSMLWLRDYDIIPEKTGNRKIIHGHVPVSLQLIDLSIKNNFYKFIDLDNGPYISGKDGFGNLVALELMNMQMVIQDNRDL